MPTLSLEGETESASQDLWLLSLARNLEDYEFFYALNVLTDFEYCRENDLILEEGKKKFYHSVYKGFSLSKQISVQFFSNEAFFEENEEKAKTRKTATAKSGGGRRTPHRFIPDYPEVQFIVRMQEGDDDFSLLLLPEKLIFSPKKITVEEDSALYQTIAYYE